MKQSMISFGMAFVAVSLLVGCGKKKEVKMEKSTTMEMRDDSMLMGAPEESYIFDENFEDVDQFAFVDAENQGVGSLDSNASDILAYSLDQGNEGNFNKVYFDFNSDKLRSDQQAAMHENIEAAKELASQGKNIEIRAYRCQMGDSVYNMALSQRSANVIKKEMIHHGIPETKVVALGCGQENPVVSSNANDRVARIKELAPNRRVEIGTL